MFGSTVNVEFTHIHAWRFGGIWHVEVSRGGGVSGYGTNANWLDAVNAAIEDLKTKLH